MKFVLAIVIIVIVIIWLMGLFNSKWTGFYYPNEGDLLNYKKSPELKSLDECRSWVNGMVNKYNPNGYGYDYECGKNCKLSDSGIDIYHCKETVE